MPRLTELEQQREQAEGKRGRCIRWWIAGILVGVALLVTGWSSLTDHLRVCDDLVARVGSQATVQSCRPLAITDVPVLFTILLALGFLAPDLRSIKIAGIVEIERKVDEQNKLTKDLTGEVKVLSATAAVTIKNIVQIAASRWAADGDIIGPDEHINPDDPSLDGREQAFHGRQPEE